MRKAFLTRTESFSASHRLYSPRLSAAENKRLFGPCSRENGHGHNYKIHVTAYGDIDPVTGIVIDLNRLKTAIRECILDKFDHRHLNLDVPEFQDLNPTAENIARVSWDSLFPLLGSSLYEIILEETEKNKVTYRG